MSGTEQSFQTQAVQNTQASLYALAILAPDAQSSVVASYTFPLGPQAVRKEMSHLTAIHDVQGAAGTFGVGRLADLFGRALPFYTLEGTTGWRYHSTDGFAFTGLQSIQQLEAILKQFEDLNQQQMAAGNPRLYKLEFYDFFKEDFYEIVPVGAQGLRQSAASPLLSFYLFRFAAMRDLSDQEIPEEDEVQDALFNVGATSAIYQVATQCGNYYGDY